MKKGRASIVANLIVGALQALLLLVIIGLGYKYAMWAFFS